VLLTLILAAAWGAPFISPHDPSLPNVASAFQAPSIRHWFGTDNLGRDVLTRVIYGAQTSLYMGIIPIALAAVLGGTLGVLAGYFGRKIDLIVSGFCDVLLAFPGILLALAISGRRGGRRVQG